MISLPYSGGLDQPLQCLRPIFFLQPPNSFGTEIHLGVKRWDSECKVCYVEFWRYIEPRRSDWGYQSLPYGSQHCSIKGHLFWGPQPWAQSRSLYIHRHTYILELIENGRQHTSWPGLRNDFFLKASKHICYAFSNEPLDMAVNGTKERLTKEAVRRELAAEAARAQIAKAQEAKEALVTQARANAACAISAVQERKKRDEERHLMELALAKETLEEAQKQSNARIEAAEGSLLRAGEEGRLRVQAAEQRNQDAIEMAKGVAVESKALSQARVEDAKRRTAEIEALVQLQVG